MESFPILLIVVIGMAVLLPLIVLVALIGLFRRSIANRQNPSRGGVPWQLNPSRPGAVQQSDDPLETSQGTPPVNVASGSAHPHGTHHDHGAHHNHGTPHDHGIASSPAPIDMGHHHGGFDAGSHTGGGHH